MTGARRALWTLSAWAAVTAWATTAHAQAPTGILSLTISPPARFYLDNELVGTGTEHRVTLPAGPHRLQLQHADFEPYRRVVTIEAGRTLTLTIPLAEKALPRQRTLAAPATGRAGVRPSQPPPTLYTDPDVAQGVAWFKEGDFSEAIDVLFVAARNLEGVARAMPQRARAYLFLGASLLEMNDIANAKTAFAIAQRLDRTLVPAPTEFSAEVRRTWTDARTASPDADLQVSGANTPLRPTATPQPSVAAASSAPPSAPAASAPVPAPSVPATPRDATAPPAVASTPDPGRLRPDSIEATAGGVVPRTAQPSSPLPSQPIAMPTTATSVQSGGPGSLQDVTQAPSPSAPATTALEREAAPSDLPVSLAPVTTGGSVGLTSNEVPPATDAPPDAEFMVDENGRLHASVALLTTGAPCPGTLTLDTPQQALGWFPASPGCLAEFAVPFSEVRSPAAAPHGGLLIQFRSDRPSMTVFPAPDTDLLSPEVAPMLLSELPPEARVNLRRMHRRVIQALGRPYSDSLFGLLVDAPLASLFETPADYEGGAIRTRGTFSATSPRGPFALTEEGTTVDLVPSTQAAALFRNRATEWAGQSVMVSGTFSRPAATDPAVRRRTDTPTRFYITANSIEPTNSARLLGSARPMTLEQVVKDPPRSNDTVRVVGRFRGKNFYGDLPNTGPDAPTRLLQDWWVIKDEVFSIWVAGRPPKGEGFALNPNSQIDRQNWMAVTGRIEERKGVLVMRAERVELSPPPSDSARAAAATVRSGRALTRPDIAFTEPIEGIGEITSRDQQLLIQFTKPMDENSFRGTVQLRYADDPANPFPRVSVTYYPDRSNSIMIDPGTALQPGRTLECVLLPGIRDVDNQPLLTPTAGPHVLRWKIAGR